MSCYRCLFGAISLCRPMERTTGDTLKVYGFPAVLTFFCSFS
jgi:hypothetical protein